MTTRFADKLRLAQERPDSKHRPHAILALLELEGADRIELPHHRLFVRLHLGGEVVHRGVQLPHLTVDLLAPRPGIARHLLDGLHRFGVQTQAFCVLGERKGKISVR